MSENGPAIAIRDLVKEYASSGGAPPKKALKGVSFDVPQGGISACSARTGRASRR